MRLRPRIINCLILLALAACGKHQEPGAQGTPPRNAVVTTVRTMDVPVLLKQFGRVRSPEIVDMRPQVSGQITGVHFQEGQEIEQGDLLFVIDPRPFQADLKQAEAQLKSDEAQLAVNRKNLQRLSDIGRQRFVSEQEIDNLAAQVANFEGAVERDMAAIDRAKLNLEYCEVRAPVRGRTGRRLVDRGNYVTTGNDILVNIQRLDLVFVDFNVSENDLARVRENMAGNQLPVEVTQPARPDLVTHGTLSFLDNVVSTQAGTVLLRATIPNDHRYLWPGQYVNVALTLKTLKGVSVVPSQTVQLSKQGPFLFAVKPDRTVEKRLVKTGPQYGNYLVIEEGVSANETVVVEGQIALANGIKIQPKDYQNDAPAQSPDLTQRDPTPNEPAIKPPVSPAKRPAS